MAKTTNSVMNRVPPFMPILWQDWESDPDTSTMTDLQVGILLKMLLRQWVVGSVPANVSDIIRECKLDSGRNTVLRFLESYPHLWTCDGCGADFVKTECGCSTDASRTSGGCSKDAERTSSVRRTYRRRTNPRLKNLRIDVNSGLELGTTKPNRTEPEPKTKPEPAIPAVLSNSFQSESEGPPASQATPVQSETKASFPVSTLEAPSAGPTTEQSPAELAAVGFFTLLGQPKEHRKKATDWSKTMSSLMDEAEMELDEYRAFLTWAVEQNPMSAEYLRMANDPMGSLEKNHPILLRFFRAKKAGIRAAERKPKTETNPDAEQKALDLIASLSGQQ